MIVDVTFPCSSDSSQMSSTILQPRCLALSMIASKSSTEKEMSCNLFPNIFNSYLITNLFFMSYILKILIEPWLHRRVWSDEHP